MKKLINSKSDAQPITALCAFEFNPRTQQSLTALYFKLNQFIKKPIFAKVDGTDLHAVLFFVTNAL